jgi:hypothetical protein
VCVPVNTQASRPGKHEDCSTRLVRKIVAHDGTADSSVAIRNG